MSQDNVWEWLLDESVFQLLLKSRQLGMKDLWNLTVRVGNGLNLTSSKGAVDSRGVCIPAEALSPMTWVTQLFIERFSSCQHTTQHSLSITITDEPQFLMLCSWNDRWKTSNVTGRHRGPKQKLQAGYRAPSLKRTTCIVMQFNCRVWYHVLSLRYVCIQSSGIILIP